MSRLPLVDLHVHSALSDGHGSLEDVSRHACGRGLLAVALTDHCDPMDPRRDYDYAGRLRAILDAKRAVENGAGGRDETRHVSAGGSDRLGAGEAWVARADEEDARGSAALVLVGVERGPFPVPGLPEELDIVIGSVHYLTRAVASARRGDLFNEEFWAAYREDVLKLASDPQVDVLGHIAGYLPMEPLLHPGSTFDERRAIEREIAARFFDRSWYEAVFSRAAASGKAVELHCATRTPAPDAVKLGLGLGVKFSIGSDAHSLDRVGEVSWALDLLESLGATENDVFFPESLKHALRGAANDCSGQSPRPRGEAPR
ncbi:MAG TPA: hypothetical protein GX515_07725 [Firmicutes bacterium]|nr:hypothetical protein [Bacillota bacterium]